MNEEPKAHSDYVGLSKQVSRGHHWERGHIACWRVMAMQCALQELICVGAAITSQQIVLSRVSCVLGKGTRHPG